MGDLRMHFLLTNVMSRQMLVHKKKRLLQTAYLSQLPFGNLDACGVITRVGVWVYKKASYLSRLSECTTTRLCKNSRASRHRLPYVLL